MGGALQGPPGEITGLLDLIEEHTPALRFDFRHTFGLCLDDVGDTITWGEAVDLVEELQRDTGSHLFASIAGYKWAASMADIATILLANRAINEGTRGTPVMLPLPIGGEPKPVDSATPDETNAALEYLRTSSAFR